MRKREPHLDTSWVTSIVSAKRPYQVFGNAPEDYLSYAKFYELPVHKGEWSAGYINYQEKAIWLQSIRPANPQGAVLLGHGFADHCGLWRHWIDYLLDRQMAVYYFDFPYFGLSEGNYLGEMSFAESTKIIQEIANKYLSGFARKFYCGHSTGCAYFMHPEITPLLQSFFINSIFFTPLVRCHLFLLIKSLVSSRLLPLVSVPRKIRNISTDKMFLEFLKVSDPLQKRVVSLSWVKAYLRWEQSLALFPKIENPIRVIYAGKDVTVINQASKKCYRKIFSNVQENTILGARHHIINEEISLRKPLFEQVYLDMQSS